MCKQCGEVYSTINLKDGVCITCQPNNGAKIDDPESIKEAPVLFAEDKPAKNVEKNVIFCKECGEKNDINSVQCKKCGTVMKTVNAPLSGEERLRIVGFFTFLVLPFFWFGGSVIIVVIVIASLYVMKKDKNFTVITKAREYIKYYLAFIVYVPLIVATPALIIDLFNRGYADDKLYAGLSIIFGFLIAKPIVNLFMRMFDYLYFSILREHKDWIMEHCMFSNKTVIKNDNAIDIIGRDKLNSFSVADELLKWNSLLEKGLITQDEFDEAKQKLLNDGGSQ
jgi:ribosomal protein L40E